MTSLVSVLDVSGSVFSLMATFYFIAASRWAWGISLIAIALNIVLYLYTGLFADALKDTIYLASVFYGWSLWLRGGQQGTELPISHLSAADAGRLLAIAGIAILIMSECLVHFTPSQVPYWDASTAGLSLLAQWLVCKKKVECWILWFIVDAMYVGLFFYKGLFVHCGLYVFYCGLAGVGYWRWFHLMHKQQLAPA
jgi:nicotinamide mononucleotide transporter